MYTKQYVVCTIYTLLADLNVWVKMFPHSNAHLAVEISEFSYEFQRNKLVNYKELTTLMRLHFAQHNLNSKNLKLAIK